MCCPLTTCPPFRREAQLIPLINQSRDIPSLLASDIRVSLALVIGPITDLPFVVQRPHLYPTINVVAALACNHAYRATPRHLCHRMRSACNIHVTNHVTQHPLPGRINYRADGNHVVFRSTTRQQLGENSDSTARDGKSNAMEKFRGGYPVRKSLITTFQHLLRPCRVF